VVCVCIVIGPRKTAELIKMSSVDSVGPRNNVLEGNAHGRHLANTTGQSKMVAVQVATIITVATC